MSLSRRQFSQSVTALALSPIFLTACSKEPDEGPAEVRWDRETCERCLMAIGDRNFAAQLRGAAPGETPKVHKFDDLGCAVIWLDQQSWKDNPEVEIWVNDYQNGEWIDARQAFYVINQLSPMNYGLGAQIKNTPGSLNFAQAREHIYQTEARYQQHNNAATTPENP